ncbi:hypothetical protein ACPESR_25480 [Nocardia testacea]|uniref:hypothetical protein n=1 Tax=Nocardia testacea TaxID=248551 RepID=UPI003C2F9950
MLTALGITVQLTFTAALVFIVGGLIVQHFTRIDTEYAMPSNDDTMILPQIPTPRAMVITGNAGGDVEVDYHPPHLPRDYAGAVVVAIGEHTQLVMESIDDLRALMIKLAGAEEQWTSDLGEAVDSIGRHARGASNGYPDADALHIASVASSMAAAGAAK